MTAGGAAVCLAEFCYPSNGSRVPVLHPTDRRSSVIRDNAIVSLARRGVLASLALSALLLPGAAAAQVCAPATSAIGAHLSHTRTGFARTALACSECHPPVCSTGQASPVGFGALASARGARPSWDPVTRTCSGVYCHGATLKSPVGPIAWTYVDPAVTRPNSQQCVVCHGYPPPAHSASATSCSGCHSSTVRPDGTIDVAGGSHINGALEAMGGSGFGCGGCHGYPPSDMAHSKHFGLTDAAASGAYGDLGVLQDLYPAASPTSAPPVYAFACGNCHPIDGARHMDGAVQVTLHESAAPANSLKALNASTASYDATAKTCSNVYCHSSGQAAPTFVTTPGWTSGLHLGCAGCHANPPAYASGGAGTITANSHVNLAEDGYEFGHFLGMPGPTHTSKHGGNGWGAGEDAAPMTCQTCHFDTTDPSNTGPSGFYYLDTTGNYALPGGDPSRISWGWQGSIQCGSCHGPSGAATGTGKVLPLRHVNGTRDVVFDARATLPAIPWLPAAPNTPIAPYWITGASTSLPWPAWVTFSGTTGSFSLATSTYDRATKTCSNVACHMVQQPTWGQPYVYAGSATCISCHPM
jgi:predicted CxxxxCH...CXXCH cytochrome family protein